MSGRGLASGLVAVIGAARAVTADALSYAASVTCLLLVKGDEPRPERRPAGTRQLRRDITQGLAFIARHPVLRKITACAATGNLFIAMQIALNLLFLVRVLHMRPAFAGLATALGSLGGIAGGMLAASLARRIGSARIIWFSLLVLDAPSLVLPLAAPGWRIALFVFGYGVSMFACSVFGASQLAYRQSVCPPDLRGRMNAASRWITWGVLPIGGLLGGFAGSAIGIRPSIWIAYAGSWAAGFLVYFSPLRRVRNVSDLAHNAQLGLRRVDQSSLAWQGLTRESIASPAASVSRAAFPRAYAVAVLVLVLVFLVVLVVVRLVLGLAFARVQPVELVEFVAACEFLGNGYIPHGGPFAFQAPGARRMHAGETRSIVSAPHDRYRNLRKCPIRPARPGPPPPRRCRRDR